LPPHPSQNRQKCVGGRALPRTPLGELTIPRALAGLRGRESKRKGGGEERYEKEIGEVGKG